MSRTIKQGLDYFPHDTSLSEDEKVQLLEADHGIIGYAIYNKLLERIYKDKGYYIELNDRQLRLFASNIGIDVDTCKSVIHSCLNEKLFNKKIYKEFNILTSKGIQIRYIEAARRRKLIFLRADFLLCKRDVINKEIDVNIITIDEDGNEIDVNESTQRKGKESKGKESKEKNIYGEFKNVLLLDEEYEKLVERFGRDTANDKIETLSSGIASKGYKYKSHYATILAWGRKNGHSGSKPDVNGKERGRSEGFAGKQYKGTDPDQISWAHDS